jgi:hypothetical protein
VNSRIKNSKTKGIGMKRKEFIKTTCRLMLLGGMAVSSGYLIVNNKVTAKCSVSPTCDKCGKFSGCKLPQAKELKNAKK